MCSVFIYYQKLTHSMCQVYFVVSIIIMGPADTQLDPKRGSFFCSLLILIGNMLSLWNLVDDTLTSLSILRKKDGVLNAS